MDVDCLPWYLEQCAPEISQDILRFILLYVLQGYWEVVLYLFGYHLMLAYLSLMEEKNEIAPRHPVGLGFTPTGRTVSEFIQSEHVTVGATPF